MQQAARAPLYEALEKHAEKHAKPFHVPGHKQRTRWIDPDAAKRYTDFLPLDVTELSDTDDLHHPTGAIAEAEALAAACFEAEETCFLVGGSTAGNLAMILGVCEPGDLLLVQRNVHKSIIHGLALAGAQCVFMPPELDQASGLPIAPAYQTVITALTEYPEAKAILLCSPNYYGMTADLPPIITAAHERGIPVLVDEAHGAHFGHHSAFPASAMQLGVDAAVQSTHKMLSALTMGAMLHIQGPYAPRGTIRQALRMVQSSSPSYPIMASLDLARQQLQVRGSDGFAEALLTAKEIRVALDKLPYGVLAADDPLKLSIYDKRGCLSGFELQTELEQRGCLAEMADPRHVVLALGIGSTRRDGQALIQALREIAAVSASKPVSDTVSRHEELANLSESVKRQELKQQDESMLSPPIRIKRSTSDTEAVPLSQAIGRIAGEWVIPYPPGIPLLYPGEPIQAAVLEELERWRSRGAKFQGAEDDKLQQIRVVIS